MRNLAFAPFEDVPAYRLTGAGSNDHIWTLYTSTLAEAALYLDVMLDSYEMENYEYPCIHHETGSGSAGGLHYYLEEDGEKWTLWNREDFGQGPNPYPSDASGYYGWDVLPGQWKVVFEGEGYARAESIVPDVPPPHLDVDIAMTSTRNPKLLDASVIARGNARNNRLLN